jgi:hypothetical protein
VPTPELWEQVVQILLSKFPDINWSTNLEDNTFTITSDCDGEDDPLQGAYVELSLKIIVDVTCNQRVVTPTPTPTPSTTPPVFDCELVLSCDLGIISKI